MAIDFDFSTVLAAIVLLSPLLWYFKQKRGYSYVQMIFLAVFLAYLVGITSKTLFPIYLDSSMREAVGQNVWAQVNLVPLVGLGEGDVKTSLLNILLFVPFGFLLPFFSRRSWKSMVMWGVILSISIELAQFLLAWVSGFTLRFIDANDVIFNALGAILGYCMFQIFGEVVWAILRWEQLEMNPVLDFVAHATKRDKEIKEIARLAEAGRARG